MKYSDIREEELKNKVAQDFFNKYDCSKIIGNIDFCVALPTSSKSNTTTTTNTKTKQAPAFETSSLFWAEAKKGKADICKSIVQLILTIGKARTIYEYLPPAYLGAFDAKEIAFIPFNDISAIFNQSDFNWNVAPSNHETKEFKFVLKKITEIIETNSLFFHFIKDEADVKEFIANNFTVGKSGTTKIKIDKNNFIVIYNKWLQTVKPMIAIDWDDVKKIGIIDGDFYLADLLSKENTTLKDKLFVLLKRDRYELDRQIDMGMIKMSTANFKDKQLAHIQFWNKYYRPPKEEYWDYIVERRDLLVPQDVRERKGSFYTPQIWVELSQQYLTDTLGEHWQDEYTIWDCAAGTGNLLHGLTNKYNIWASTLDQQDVDVMHDRIKNGTNLLAKHVFQFDFLNDDFAKLPKPLLNIINDPEKRKKLVIYINPPYAEGDSRIGQGRRDVQKSMIHQKHHSDLGKASGEIFAQFFIRIYRDIPNCIVGEFSKLKILQAPNFLNFRNNFLAKLKKMFIVPANTFDNVKGEFPIGFMIWDTSIKERFECFDADAFDSQNNYLSKKTIYSYDNDKFVSKLIDSKHSQVSKLCLANMSSTGNDFQNQNAIFIENIEKRKKAGGRHTTLTIKNLINVVVYFAVRKCIKATWLNDRDQFLYPNDDWKTDKRFQNDCLTYTLFSNNIQSEYGTNHWLPFTEQEVSSRGKFDSDFMTQFITGNLHTEKGDMLFDNRKQRTTPLKFSPQAKKVFAAGKKLWIYYHQQANCNINASFYDIRAHFQGRNENGKMNNKSHDEHYMLLIKDLRKQLDALAKQIQPKVYEYDFLKE